MGIKRIGWDLEPPDYPGHGESKKTENELPDGLKIPSLESSPEMLYTIGKPQDLPSSIVDNRVVKQSFFEAMRQKVVWKENGADNQLGEIPKPPAETVKEKLSEVKEKQSELSPQKDINAHLDSLKKLREEYTVSKKDYFSGITNLNSELDKINKKLGN